MAFSRNRSAAVAVRPAVRCAVYCRKSTNQGLDQEFNSLDAQREAAENYIASQRHENWVALPDRYDDGGYSGGTIERPAMKRLLGKLAIRVVQPDGHASVDPLLHGLGGQGDQAGRVRSLKHEPLAGQWGHGSLRDPPLD